MTFELFEGAAGTGKTHSLVERAAALVGDGALKEGQKVLALTFMNGARRRLSARLGAMPGLRRRFDCLTFDVFARTLTGRRRSLVSAAMQEEAAALNEFDGPCAVAAGLLANAAVRQWIARTYPLVLADEAQDLDEHRLRVLQGLSQACNIVAAADAFQCLEDGRDTGHLMDWLENSGVRRPLAQARRTQQEGLLSAALAVREGRDVLAALVRSQATRNPTWNGQGFRLVETHAANAGLVAWTISNEMSLRGGRFAILTPDARNRLIRQALETVATRLWSRGKGQTFGPFPHTWDRDDSEEAATLLSAVELPDDATCSEFRAVLAPLAGHAAVVRAIGRIDRLRRAHGRERFTALEVARFVEQAVRDRSRLGFGMRHGHLAMTIHRAKNRQFQNVILLWPHTVTGSPEHLRRLLYNGITRAQNHCTVIVLGHGRLNAPPFAP